MRRERQFRYVIIDDPDLVVYHATEDYEVHNEWLQYVVIFWMEEQNLDGEWEMYDPGDVEDDSLFVDLRETLRQVNTQIDAVCNIARSWHCSPDAVRTTSGDFMLTPLLVSKTNLLIAIKDLKYGRGIQ